MRKTMHELRNTTIFETSVSYALCILTLHVFSDMLQDYLLQHDLCIFCSVSPTHYKFIAILQCVCITNMLQVLMCTYSVEVCRQTQALDAAPLSRFPSFLPHRFRGWFFGCFISIWASRALAEPLRRRVASESS